MKIVLLVLGAALAALPPGSAHADQRYGERPPLVVSPDLSAPWVMQLRSPTQRRAQPVPGVAYTVPAAQNYRSQRPVYVQPDPVRTAGVSAAVPREAGRAMNPIYLPQEVDYRDGHAPGTIVIDQAQKFLFLVQANGKARRYGVGVGKEGFGWTGTNTISRKAEWPTWHPPAEMRARERKAGRILPVKMEGGPANPLGARALYLGSTLYRIHGTNAPWTIGSNVSSGCIRMRNEDVIDLYGRVGVGTKVVVM